MAKADKAKRTAVDQILAAVRKEFGKGAAVILGDGGSRSEVKHVIPTGIEVLDRHVIGIGGLPAGRIVELFSEEGGGKTSMLLAMLASVQAQGGTAVLAETEHAFSEERALLFRVDPKRLVILQPDSLEEAIGQLEAVLDALPVGGPPAILGFDSIAATPTLRELKEGIECKMDERAQILSKAFRILPEKAERKRACLVLINQTRTARGVMFGDPTVTPGGKALKFHASLRLQLWAGKAVKAVKRGEDHVGRSVTVKAVKNKLATPFRKASLRLDFAGGWDDGLSTLNHAKDRGVVSEDAQPGAEAFEQARAALGWAS